MKIKSLDEMVSLRLYFARIGAEVRSLRTAVVKEISGNYWRDIAVITVNKDGTLQVPDAFAPTDAELKEIQNDILKVDWPQIKPIKTFGSLPLKSITNFPEELKDVDDKDLFEFKNTDGSLIMLQHRKVSEDGEKSYIPWTFWDDDIWRKTEPDMALPLWGLDGLKDHTTVFIHEGAKAARAMREMVEQKIPNMKKKLKDHPWGEELKGAAHLGWIGGALSPYRTDWSILKKNGVKRAYIISDNDPPGVRAVPSISYHLNLPTFHIQFTNEWPSSFDLADEFPEAMFCTMEGKRRYIGPSFRSCLHPATWATDLIPNPKGRPTSILRDHFKELWAYVEEADLFICTEMPEIMRTEQILNKILAPFSHTYETARLIAKAYRGRTTKLCYRPDMTGRIITDKTTSSINLHTPTLIKSEEGDASPFLHFLSYMFPKKSECEEVKAWIATLIAHLDIRVEYGLLLVSETQGVGKTTLGSTILAPLVGLQNVGWPSENDITNSDFNDWIAQKRLCIVNEIYSGHSWKAYNKLKTLITDKEIQVNQKYQRRYTIDNWCHIIACSNSMRALKVEKQDRRLFYPEVTEGKWGKDRFVKLREWLRSGGLGIIKYWAERYENWCLPGQAPPETARKKELIAGSMTEAQVEAVHIATAMMEQEKPVAVSMKDIVTFIRSATQGTVFESDYEIRRAMKEVGVKVIEKRIKIGGRMQHVMVNKALWNNIDGKEEEAISAVARGHIVGVSSLLDAPI